MVFILTSPTRETAAEDYNKKSEHDRGATYSVCPIYIAYWAHWKLQIGNIQKHLSKKFKSAHRINFSNLGLSISLYPSLLSKLIKTKCFNPNLTDQYQ